MMVVRKKEAKLLTHLQTAESMISQNKNSYAIRQTNRVWEQIKENSREDETKC
jgi:hypothetical protein